MRPPSYILSKAEFKMDFKISFPTFVFVEDQLVRKVSVNDFIYGFLSNWRALWVLMTLKLLEKVHRKRTRCRTIFLFRWRSAIKFCFESVNCIPHPLPNISYRESTNHKAPVCLCIGKQSPLRSHEVPMVYHHENWKTILYYPFSLTVAMLGKFGLQGLFSHA